MGESNIEGMRFSVCCISKLILYLSNMLSDRDLCCQKRYFKYLPSIRRVHLSAFGECELCSLCGVFRSTGHGHI